MNALGERDLGRAQKLLRELMLILRRVPVGESTRELHLEALRLKREVSSLDESGQRAILGLLEGLKRQAAAHLDEDATPQPPGRRGVPANTYVGTT